LQTTLQRINSLPEISNQNKEIVSKFLAQLRLEGIGMAKTTRYLQDLIKFTRLLKKDFDKADKEDIKRVVGELQASNLAENTKRGFKIMLRKLYRCIEGIDERGIYPERVKWMRLDLKANHNKLPEILTDDEIKVIIEHCGNLRDKALVSILAESGCRVSEIGTLQIKNVSFESSVARILVEGKTGCRSILVVWSAPYLQSYINCHPDNKNPEAYLWRNRVSPMLTYQRIRTILGNAAKKAGIKKRVHPHLLRHTAATRLAGFMTDGQLKKYMGWTSSRMIGVYTHLSGKDTDEPILRANGIEVKKEKVIFALEPVKCLRCQTENEATNRHCRICGLPLFKEEAEKLIKADAERQQADDIMNTLIKDPEIMALIKKKLNS